MDSNPTSNLYATVLSLFVAKSDTYREWMESPFKIGNMAYATDGNALAIMDASIVPNLTELTSKAREVLAVIPKERTSSLVISITDINAAMEKAPLVDGFELKENRVTCGACDGSGEVEFEFSHDGDDYYTDCDCPVCDGIGKVVGLAPVPNGQKMPDPDYNYSFNGAAFSTSELTRIVRVANLLEVDSIMLTHQAGPMGNHIFQIGNIEILQMPLSLPLTDPGKIIAVI